MKRKNNPCSICKATVDKMMYIYLNNDICRECALTILKEVINEIIQSVNTVGQTLSDFITFEEKDNKFLEYLKTKYKTDEKKKEE